MTVTWDEHKREANLLKHGLDFADFDASFDAEAAMILPTRPSRTGRLRHMLIGEWNGALVVAVIVSPLGTEALDIVSIRPAIAKERKIYDDHQSQA
ncbi:BrnT family toxin [Methylobacterium sp. E-045]|uniref:BrnT family toxin n=1 Tax=Methylobacterium sp. E-045 TaxID=2836575 RepID=UPI001FBBB991|nr:BrnT family toxin [Methylobacterium sp. E-045]MCJ2130906.1 BrnT family toxin [Methylobacterium sp. E-045]